MARVLVFLCVCLCYQLVFCQFGFFPREQRRYQNSLGFTQNFIPNTANRFRNTLGGILHLRPQTPADNNQYVYPFQNQNQNRPNQYNPYNNNQPSNVRFPNQGYPNQGYPNLGYPNQGYPNQGYPNQFYNNQGNQDEYYNGQNNQGFNQRPVENLDQQTGYGFENGDNNNGQALNNADNNQGNFGNNDGGDANGFVSGQNNGPAFEQGATEAPNFGNQENGQITSGQQDGPAFGGGAEEAPNFGNQENGQITSGQQDGPAFGQNNGGLISGQNNGPAFGQEVTQAPNFGNQENGQITSGQQDGPAFGQNNGANGGLISGQNNGQVFGQNNGGLISGQNNGPAFGQEVTQAPTFGNDQNGQITSGQQDGPVFGQNNRGNGGLISGQINGPAPTKVPTFASENDIQQNQTPVPSTGSRNNFGTDEILQEPCPTVDNGVGTCRNIKSCPPYVKLLEQARSNSAAIQVLRKAHCGFDGSTPMVCCPTLPIPEATTAPAPTQPPTQAPTSAPDASVKSLASDFISAFPEPPECGLSNATFSRVVGGVNAKLGDFPWMALLGYKGKRSPTTSWLCGGSLVSRHHVLTAAHCIHNHEDDLYVVRVGELDLAREDDGATPLDVLIKYKIKHEGYNPKAFTNDIGLLVLENDVPFTDLIRPICIPKDSNLRSTNFEDYTPFIAGWGDTEFRGPKATHLQVLQLPVVSNDFCRQAYTAYKAQVIDERVLCAGFKKGGKDSCQGDSGGPLMQPIYNPDTLTTYFYQIGVVSFGKKCAEPGFPGVYSRVTSFVPWLQKNMLGV